MTSLDPVIARRRIMRFLPVLLMTAMTWNTAQGGEPDFTPFQEILDRYLTPDSVIDTVPVNVLDYARMSRDSREPASPWQRQLAALAEFSPRTLRGREERLAFWINVYNIGAIKMVLDHWPVDSIRAVKIHLLKNPWQKKIIIVGGRSYSLHEIEHDILLGRLREPLAHFAIVCASVSCPDLSPRIYAATPPRHRFSAMMVDPARLESRLRRQAALFLQNGKKGLKIDRKTATVFFSRIFQFDKKSFPNGARSAVPLIVPLLTDRDDAAYLLAGNYRIAYLDYNWRLNGN